MSAPLLVLVSAADLPADPGWLHPAAAARVLALRTERRRRDHLLGRYAAARLLCLHLGLPVSSAPRLDVRPAADGAPEPWLDGRPLALSLSISHRDGHAAAALAPAALAPAAAGVGLGVGVDLERIEPRSEAFLDQWLWPDEAAAVRASPDPALRANLLWSAREAALKVLRTGLRLDPRAVRLELPGPGPLAPEGSLRWWVEGLPPRPAGWQRHGDLLLTWARGAEVPPPGC
ncbi:4'-phosphopantetheinyl transferase superfamily protein [Myxococcota bacterium]|nr:4'-phosphopantetheinyl transferase superfamily protein [Myxococcota bacterium]